MKASSNGVKVKGEIFVIKDRCKGCGFCITNCPRDILELSAELNANGYHFPVVKNPDNCNNCGLCEMICPDFAIWSVKKEERRVVEV